MTPNSTPTKSKEKYKWAEWINVAERPYRKFVEKCICGKKAMFVVLATENFSYDEDEVVIKARCEEHYNKQTQKKWLRIWRNKNINL